MSSNKSTFWSRKKCIDSTVVLYLSSELDLEFLARIWVGFTIFEIVKSEDHLIIHFTNYSWQPSLNWEISFEQLAPCLGSFFYKYIFFFRLLPLDEIESSKNISKISCSDFLWKLSVCPVEKLSRKYELKKIFTKRGCVYKAIYMKKIWFLSMWKIVPNSLILVYPSEDKSRYGFWLNLREFWHFLTFHLDLYDDPALGWRDLQPF